MQPFTGKPGSLYYIGHLTSPCSYLPERESSLLFLEGDRLGREYRRLLDEGFRRHGARAYRPDCPACAECRVLRIPLETFRPSKSQRRAWNRGLGFFRYEIGKPEYSAEKMALYRDYLKHQHDEEEEARPEEFLEKERYEDFFVKTMRGLDTIELRLFREDRLAGIGILDRLEDALSSVYFYFAPEFSRNSPGTYSMLLELELAREWGLAFYYPGYFIRECKTMNYKNRFRPCEHRAPGEDVWFRE